ncbi:MAG: alpha/beta fold hydrolase [Alistipes sp.]
MRKLFIGMLWLLTAMPLVATERGVALKRDFGTLYGTLRTPEAGSEVAALFITGSGPMDRDNNSRRSGIYTNTYLFLAQELERQGIASLRYDKRGIEASRYDDRQKMSEVVFDDFVGDAAALVSYLKAQSFKRIVLVGHSEGSLIALCVAATSPDVSGVISLAGAGFPVDEIIQIQLAGQLVTNDMGLLMRATAVINALRQGRTVEDYPRELATLFQPYLQRFWISEMKYKPQEVIRRVTAPILIVNGDNDIQISVANAKALKEASPKSELLVIEGMTHTLRQSTGRDAAGQLDAYLNPDLPLDPTLAVAIPRFIHALKL